MDFPPKEHAAGSGPLRRAARVDIELPVGFQGSRGSGLGVTTNISVGGLFVATLRALPVGEHVIVSFAFPGDGVSLEVLGEVRWQRCFQELDDRPLGWGVRFIDTPMRAAILARAAGIVRTGSA
jgi:uncharacterized protein (TIGR02266 family)